MRLLRDHNILLYIGRRWGDYRFNRHNRYIRLAMFVRGSIHPIKPVVQINRLFAHAMQLRDIPLQTRDPIASDVAGIGGRRAMINFLRELWRDEAGYVMSAEAVTVGSIGVVGATVGIGAMSKSVNEELTETASAIRSLNQSFVVPEQCGAGSWTAGSCFIQPISEDARADLGRPVENHGGAPLENGSTEHREELRRIRQRERLHKSEAEHP